MDLHAIYKPVETELLKVEESLATIAQSSDPAIAEVISDVLGAGGKRLRPALLLIAARACNYSGDRAVRLAVAVELVHTASLIHDDVIDDAHLRRGNKTINADWGSKTAILAGDHVYAKVIQLLADDGDVTVMRALSASAAEMTEGEMAQSMARIGAAPDESDYLSIIERKTASLLSCSCGVGALLGEVHNGEVEALSNYGLSLGMAFQITDDLLDITGTAGSLGKPPWQDLTEGSVTLPFIHTMRQAGEEDLNWMLGVFGADDVTHDDRTRMRALLDSHGSIDYCLEKTREYGNTCKQALETLRESESRDSLHMLADHVVGRTT